MPYTNQATLEALKAEAELRRLEALIVGLQAQIDRKQ